MDSELVRLIAETFGAAGAAGVIGFLYFRDLKDQISTLTDARTALEARINELQDERAEELARQIELLRMLTKNSGTGS